MISLLTSSLRWPSATRHARSAAPGSWRTSSRRPGATTSDGTTVRHGPSARSGWPEAPRKRTPATRASRCSAAETGGQVVDGLMAYLHSVPRECGRTHEPPTHTSRVPGPPASAHRRSGARGDLTRPEHRPPRSAAVRARRSDCAVRNSVEIPRHHARLMSPPKGRCEAPRRDLPSHPRPPSNVVTGRERTIVEGSVRTLSVRRDSVHVGRIATGHDVTDSKTTGIRERSDQRPASGWGAAHGEAHGCASGVSATGTERSLRPLVLGGPSGCARGG